MPGLFDALDYAGSVAEKFGGREVRGLLGGKPRELLSAIPFSDTLGITDPRERVTGHDLASQWGLTSAAHPWASGAAGLGIDLATDPLNWGGGGALARALGMAGKAGEAASGASKIPLLRSLAPEGLEGFSTGSLLGSLPTGTAEAASRVLPWGERSRLSKLRELREPTQLYKEFGDLPGRVVGGKWNRPRDMSSQVADVVDAVNEGLPKGVYAQGALSPPWSPANPGIGFATSPEVARHELSHALVHNAAYSGRGIEELPFFGRQAARQYQAAGFEPQGFRAGLGSILDELNAAGTDVSKTRGYLRGALDPVFSREFHRSYNPQFSHASPLAAGLFHATPGAVLGGTAGAVGGGVGGGMEGDPTTALEGALLGGLAGAAGGGALSHLLMSPALNRASSVAPGMSRALGLKHDLNPDELLLARELGSGSVAWNKTPESVGLARHDPEWINNRTFYHGTGTPNLTAASLDPRKTAADNLYRRGIYTTEEAGRLDTPVTQGYAEARGPEAFEKALGSYASTPSISKAIKEGRISRDDLAYMLRDMSVTDIAEPTAWVKTAEPKILASRVRRDIENMASEMARHPEYYTPEAAPEHVLRILQGLGPVPQEHKLIYQGQSNFGKILDLDVQNPQLQGELAEVIRGAPYHLGESPDYARTMSSVGKLIQAVPAIGHESDALTQALKSMGYDALTHGGGGRTGGGLHQVVIGLDPNDFLKTGRATPYQQWELYKRLTGG